MVILFTRPRHDKPTHYLFYWTQKIIDQANNKGIRVIDLDKKKAKRKNVQSYLKKNIPNIVVFNGHGNSSSITGHDNEILISVSDNPELLKDKVVFMRACQSAIELGPLAFSLGAKGFIGYKDNFVFLYNDDFFKTPLRDGLARPFMECSNKVAVALIKGHSANESDQMSKDLYRKEISQLLNSESDSYMVPYLLGNMNNQVCFS